MKFIHVADLHLDSPLRGLERYEGAPVEQIRGATRQALVRLVDRAQQEQVDFVLIAGDVYDGDWKDYNTGLFFAAQMSRLREAGIRVFLISGNHDAASQISRSLRLPDNVYTFADREPETRILEDCGVAIHGQGFSQRVVADDLSLHYKPALPGLFNIGLLHTSVTGRPGHETYAPCSIEGLCAKNYDYWALGHVHAREILHASPWIVFPGNLQGRHIRETGPKGCSLVTVEQGRVNSVQPLSLDVLRWSVCLVEGPRMDTAEEAMDLARQSLRRALEQSAGCPLAVRVQLQGPSAAHSILLATPEKWSNEIRAMATDLGEVWVEKVKFQTHQPGDLEAALRGEDALSQLVRAIHTLDLEPEFWEEMSREVAELKRKLPLELREGEQALTLESAEKRAELLRDVRQILLPRLLSLTSS